MPKRTELPSNSNQQVTAHLRVCAPFTWVAMRLVTAYTVTVRQRRLRRDRARRVIRRAWVACGKSRPATGLCCVDCEPAGAVRLRHENR
jgi:hypothetical protein